MVSAVATSQNVKAARFKSLHIPGKPLQLFNVWDAGSARAVAESGAAALATGSWSVAAASGFGDGEAMPIELVLANAARIAAATALPVSCDFEGAYAAAPHDVGRHAAQLVTTGVIGVNFEDQIIGGTGVYSVDDQSARIRAMRSAVQATCPDFFINARTDIFLKSAPAAHDDALLAEALVRANAYASAGASGFFVPGLRDARLLSALCARAPLPVNVMVLADTLPPAQLAELGVARISYGPGPYRRTMAWLAEQARAAFGDA